MDAAREILRTSHIWAGFALLALFWIPLLVKKGSKGHVMVGRIYSWLMFGVLFSAAALSIHRAIYGNWALAVSLGLLTLISFNSLWYGYAVAVKKKLTPGIANTRKVLLGVTLVYSIILLYLGIRYQQVLFIIFALLAVLPFTPFVLALVRKEPQQKFSWLREHYTNMIVSGGAAYTAFLAFGARVFFTFPDNTFMAVLPWVLPTAVALLGVAWSNKRYLKQ